MLTSPLLCCTCNWMKQVNESVSSINVQHFHISAAWAWWIEKRCQSPTALFPPWPCHVLSDVCSVNRARYLFYPLSLWLVLFWHGLLTCTLPVSLFLCFLFAHTKWLKAKVSPFVTWPILLEYVLLIDLLFYTNPLFLCHLSFYINCSPLVPSDVAHVETMFITFVDFDLLCWQKRLHPFLECIVYMYKSVHT